MTVTRLCLRPLDYDNLVGCYKHHIDAIVKAGILTDDGPKVIVEPKYEQVTVRRAEDQKTIIVIESV